MKKIFMTTTALVAFGLITGQAMAADAPTVTLGGFSQWNYYVSDNKNSSGNHVLDGNEAELHIMAKGSADNGLTYGATFEMFATNGNGTANSDENYLWLTGNFGTVEIGSNDGAADVLGVRVPTGFGTGGLDGDWGNGGTDWTFAGPTFSADETDDANKISYFGSFGAVNVGISYVPYTTAEDHTTAPATAGGYINAVEAGITYTGNAGGYDFTVGAVGTTGSSRDVTLEDLSTWEVGANVSRGAWVFGINYADNGNSGEASTASDDEDMVGVGATYTTGDWTFGANYAMADDGANDADVLAVGLTYAVAPGLSVGAEVVAWDEKIAGVSDDGQVYILTSSVAF